MNVSPLHVQLLHLPLVELHPLFIILIILLILCTEVHQQLAYVLFRALQAKTHGASAFCSNLHFS